jgi:hypothetical protein
MLRRVTLVRTDVSEELSASFIRVTTVGELGFRPEPLSSLQIAPQLSSRDRWTPFQTHYYFENLVAPGIEPGTSEYVGSNSVHKFSPALVISVFAF